MVTPISTELRRDIPQAENARPVKLRLKAAAKEIGICYASLRGEIKRGNIASERISPRVSYVYRSEIDSYLRRKQQPRIGI